MKNQRSEIFWQIYAHVYDLVRLLPPYQHLLQDVKKGALVKPNIRVLDVGCGTGNFMELVAKDKLGEYVGIDISKVMLSKARKKVGSFTNMRLFLASVNDKLPLEKNYFDSIVAINSIYAVSNPAFTVSELLRVLKPGGTLVIVNPHSKAKFTAAYFEIINSVKGFAKVKMFFITLPLFFFNLIIKLKANNKGFHFLSQEEWEEMVKNLNIKSISIKETYMQSYLLVLTKKD